MVPATGCRVPAVPAGPGGRPGANVDGGGVGPAGARFSVRAPGGACVGSGTGVPGTFGGGSPGTPGDRHAGRRRQAVGVRRRRRDVGRSREARAAEGAVSAPAQGSGFHGRGNPSSPTVTLPPGLPACTSTASPGGRPVRDDPGCPPAPGARAAGRRWGTECRWGRATGTSGSPALRQKFSGSMPRFLKAASTNGCRIWPGSRLCRTTLKYGPDAIASFSDGRNLPTSVNPVAEVVLALDQDVADGAQLLQHVVEVRVVVDRDP